MQNRIPFVWVLSIALLTACATDMPREAATSAPALDRDAGTWRTWVLVSGKQMRLPPPPDAAATATETEQLRTLAAQRDAAAQERIRYWDYASPSYRWNTS